MGSLVISVIVPVYMNADTIGALLSALEKLQADLSEPLEVVFVVDGSPDTSHALLAAGLPQASFPSQLISLSRNFGSFAAIRAGLEAAQGEILTVMSADLQEPPDLILSFEEALASGRHDVAVGVRIGRDDPVASRLLSRIFWSLYRRFIQPEIPPGGVDIFACTRLVRDRILELQESRSSLVGLLFWVGFRRAEIPYRRRPRVAGRSAWTLSKRINYLLDSLFSFSDLPIRLLLRIGLVGLLFSICFTSYVACVKLLGNIPVPGYAATVVLFSFFGGLNCFALGVIGSYVWRAFENTKGRPNYIVRSHTSFE